MARGGDGAWQPRAEAWSGWAALTAQLWGIVSTRTDSIPGGGGAGGGVPGLWLRGVTGSDDASPHAGAQRGVVFR